MRPRQRLETQWEPSMQPASRTMALPTRKPAARPTTRSSVCFGPQSDPLDMTLLVLTRRTNGHAQRGRQRGQADVAVLHTPWSIELHCEHGGGRVAGEHATPAMHLNAGLSRCRQDDGGPARRATGYGASSRVDRNDGGLDVDVDVDTVSTLMPTTPTMPTMPTRHQCFCRARATRLASPSAFRPSQDTPKAVHLQPGQAWRRSSSAPLFFARPARQWAFCWPSARC
jgi:hypothetical protein